MCQQSGAMKKLTGTMKSLILILLLNCAGTSAQGYLPSFFGGVSQTVQSIGGGGVTESVVPLGTITRTSTGDATQAQFYTVTQQFVDLINHVREHDTNVKLSLTPTDNGNYDVLLTTNTGESKTFQNVDKASIILFQKLVQDPTLQIKVVGQVGSKIQISVAPEPPKPSNIITVKPEFLEVLTSLRKQGGAQIQISIRNNKYFITVTDTSGTKTYKDIPSDIGKQFVRLAQDPNLEYQIISQTSTQVVLFIPDVSGQQTTFTISQLFLDLLNEVKTNPDNQLQIETGTDGKYVLIINGKKYEHIDPDLLYVFVKLIREPDIQFRVTPAAGGKLTITLQPKPATPNVIVIDEQELRNIITEIVNNPTYKLEIVQGDTGLVLVVKHDNKEKRFQVPKQLLTILLKIFSLSHPQVQKPDGNSISITGGLISTGKIEIDAQFIDIITTITSHPDDQFTFKVQPNDNGKYTVIIIVNGQPRTIDNVSPKAVQFLIKVSKDPHSPFQIVVVTTPAATTTTTTTTTPAPTTAASTQAPTTTTTQKPSTGGILVYPDDHNKPTTIPDIHIEILQIVKSAPQLIINIVPQKDHKFTIILTDGKKVTKYPDVDPDFIIKLIDVRREHDLPIDIRPGKPGSVEVDQPTGDRPDTNEITVNIDLLKPITIIRQDPTIHISITPDDDGTFTITLKDGTEQKPIHHVKPDVVILLVELKTHPNPKFTITTGKKPGTITFVVPKTQPEPVTVKYTPEIINLIIDSRKKPEPKITIKPGKKPDTFTIEIDGKPYPDLPAQLVPVIIHLTSQPDVDIEIKPGKDNTIQIIRPKPSPDSHKYPTRPNTLEIISNIRRHPNEPIEIKPGKQPGTFDITIPDKDGNPKTYPDKKPDTIELIFYLKSHPDQPFSVKPTPDGNLIILVPKSQSQDDKVPLRPNILVLLHNIQDHPNVDITIKPQPDNKFTIVINDGKKPKEIKDIPLKALPIIIRVYTRPDTRIPVIPNGNGDLTGKIPHDTTDKIHSPVDVVDIELIHDIKRRRPVVDIHLDRNDDDSTIDVTVEQGPHGQVFKHVRPKIVNIVTKLITQPKLPYNILTDKDGRLVVVLQERPRDKLYSNIPTDTVKFIDGNRNNPHLTVDVTRGDKPNTYNVVFSDAGKPLKKFPNSSPDTTQLLVLLYTEPDIEYRTVPEDKPNEVSIIPSHDDVHTIDVPIKPELVHLIYDIRQPEVTNVDIVPRKNNKYTIVYTLDGQPKSSPEVGPLILNLIVRLRTEPRLPIKIYVVNDRQPVVTVPKRVSHNIYPHVDLDVANYLKTVKPESSEKPEEPEKPSKPKAVDTTFSIKPDGDRPGTFTIEIQRGPTKKQFPHQPSTTVQLLVLLLSQPQLNYRIISEVNGQATIHVTSHLPYVVFRHVRPSFLHLSEIVRHDPEVSVTIERKPTNELDVGVTNRLDTLNLRNVQPIITELFVALFSRNNFPYHYYLDTDDSVTLVIRKDSLNPRFYDVKPELFEIIKTLRLPKLLRVTISHDVSIVRYNVEIVVGNGKPKVFKGLRPQDVQLLTLFVTYFDLPFQEHPLPNGNLIIDVTISARLALFDFALLTSRVEVVEAPQPLPRPVYVPEVRLVPKLKLRPEVKLVRELVAQPEVVPVLHTRPGFRQVIRGLKAEPISTRTSLAVPVEEDIRLRSEYFPAQYDESLYNRDFDLSQGSDLYYANLRAGLIGGGSTGGGVRLGGIDNASLLRSGDGGSTGGGVSLGGNDNASLLRSGGGGTGSSSGGSSGSGGSGSSGAISVNDLLRLRPVPV